MEKHDSNTTLRHSATRFQNLLEFFPAGVIIVDNSHRILIVNRQFETMFGYDRAEIIGRSAEIFLAERFVRHFDSTGEPHLNPEILSPLHHSGESFVCHKDGSQFPVDIHIGRIETADGIEFVATIRDISEKNGSKYNLNITPITMV